MQQENLALLFPGQGSQKIGMLADLADQYKTVEQTFAEASSVLGYDLWQRVQHGQQEEINLTECTQPLLLTASVALWHVWNEQGGPRPSLLAGHSLGEWSALVCSNVVDFTAAVDLVRRRGAFMQQAVPQGEGAMAAIIGLDDEEIILACREAEHGLEVRPVNYNSPGQVVIAGATAAVERAVEKCKAAGAKRAMPLPVSAPFHTEMMRPAADNLADFIMDTEFRTPEIRVVHNVNAATESNPETIKKLMIEQIYQPVLWVDCVNTLVKQGITTTVECGPGKVLSGLSRRINKNITSLATEGVASLEKALESLS